MDQSELRNISTVTPLAVWRLIEVGETARLISNSGRNAALNVFNDDALMSARIGPVLRAYRCNEVELYILVTLFAAAPKSVTLERLERETLRDSVVLSASLQHLQERGAIAAVPTGLGDKREYEFTELGYTLAVCLLNRTLRAAV